jgi:hypothetical protein
MKGIELFGSIVALIIMFMGSVIFQGINIFVLNNLERSFTFRLALSPIYPPIKYEVMLLAYLESTDDVSGIQIKKILTYAAYQRNITNVFIGEKEITTLPDTSSKIFLQWFKDSESRGYLLVLNVAGRPYVLAENKRGFVILSDSILNLKKVSIPLYIDEEIIKKSVGINEELPLNVTLDLYVQ